MQRFSESQVGIVPSFTPHVIENARNRSSVVADAGFPPNGPTPRAQPPESRLSILCVRGTRPEFQPTIRRCQQRLGCPCGIRVTTESRPSPVHSIVKQAALTPSTPASALDFASGAIHAPARLPCRTCKFTAMEAEHCHTAPRVNPIGCTTQLPRRSVGPDAGYSRRVKRSMVTLSLGSVTIIGFPARTLNVAGWGTTCSGSTALLTS